MASENDTF